MKATALRWEQVDSFAGNFTSQSLSYRRACPMCGGEDARPVLEFPGFQFYSDSASLPKRVDICQMQCAGCFALYLNPCYSASGLEILLAEAGMSYGAHDPERYQEQLEWMNSRSVLRAGECVLDVGCYDGAFLAHLPDNLRRVGVDIEPIAIERGKQRYGPRGIEFVLGDFESFHFPDTVGLFTMFHVLEHLPRPVAVLQKLRALSREDARLVVEVPILERGNTTDLCGFFSAHHLTHFSRQSLRGCLARAGWQIEEWHEIVEYGGCRVLASPGSVPESVEGDANDGEAVDAYLKAWRKGAAAAERRLSQLGAGGQCVVWGGGAHTEFLYHTTRFFQENPDRRFLIVDSDPQKQGKSWRGIQIEDSSAVSAVDWSDTTMVISSYGSQEAIRSAALGLGVPAKRIVRLYDAPRVR